MRATILAASMRCVRCVLCVLAAWLVAPEGRAEPPPQPVAAPTADAKAEARTRYLRGLKLAEGGAYEQAVAEFLRAYELAPTFKIFYNVGLVYMQHGEPANALR